MNDEDAGLITGKRGPKKGSANDSVCSYWREILGPELTEDLIKDAWDSIENGSWKERAKPR